MAKPKTEYTKRCATDAGRRAMFQALENLAAELNIECRLGSSFQPREIRITLAKGPFAVSTTFSAHSAVGAFLGHWFIEHRTSMTFPRDFGATIGGSMNEFHYRKATTATATFDLFVESLRRGFTALDNVEI